MDEINITLHPPSLEWQSHLSDIVVTSSLGSRRCKTERVTRENTWQRQSDEAELLPSTLERGEHEAEVPSSPRPLSKSDTRYAAKRGDTPEWVRLSAAGRRRRALDGSWRKVRPGKIQWSVISVNHFAREAACMRGIRCSILSRSTRVAELVLHAVDFDVYKDARDTGRGWGTGREREIYRGSLHERTTLAILAIHRSSICLIRSTSIFSRLHDSCQLFFYLFPHYFFF